MNNFKAKKIASLGILLATFAIASGTTAFAADTPPSIDLGNLMSQTSELKISKASAFPAGFDPTKQEKAVITYQVSATALVKVEVLDDAKSVIVILVNNEQKEAGMDQAIEWDGTDNPVGGGTIMPAGNYTYRITATDPADDTNQDIIEGTVQLLYGGFTGQDTTADTSTAAANTAASNDVVTMHNSPPKNTSGTGPETLIYLALPFLGPIVMRLRRR